MSRPVRGLPGFLLLAVAAVAVLALVVVPLVVRPLVTSAIQAASPFGDVPLDVEVDVNAVSLALGSIDGVRLSGRDLETKDGVRIGALDIDLRRVSTSGRSFAAAGGTLTNIEAPWLNGEFVTIDQVDLGGPSSGVDASVRLGQQGAIDFLYGSLLDAGVAVDGIALADGGITVTVFGQDGFLLVGAEDGALVIPDLFGGGPFTVLGPGPDDPWRITGVTTTTDAMVIGAVVDGGTVLGSR